MFNTMFSALDKNKNATSMEINKIQSFIFCKWLSGSPQSIFTANEINQFYDIPIENQYYLVKHKLAGKVRNIKYIKTDKINNPDIDILIKHFKINQTKAIEYLNIINKNELHELRKIYELKK